MDRQVNIKEFRFIKRKLSVHNSIINDMQIKKRHFSNSNSKTSSNSKKRRKSMIEQEESIKKLREAYIKNKRGFTYNKKCDLSKYEEPELNYNSITNFLHGSYDKEFQKILYILTSNYEERKEDESEYLLSFLMNQKISEILKTDMFITELTIPELFEYFKPYIFGKKYSFMDTIYYNGEEAENLYLVLYGSVGQYRLEVYEEELTCEEYFIFLSDCYNLYEEEFEMGFLLTEEEEPKKGYKITFNSNFQMKKNVKKDNKENNKDAKKETPKKEEDNNFDMNIYNNYWDEYDDEDDKKEQYIDHYLICQMIEENKEIYPLKDISDLIRLKKIIFKIRLYMTLSDGKPRDAEILYALYDFPTTYLNFDKVLDGIISVSKYVEILSYNFKQYDYFYMKLLGPLKHKIKLMKYVKYHKNIEPYSFFGNYELINVEAKRNLTTRCETEECVLLCINKRMYNLAVYNSQKKKRDKELESMHSCYLFKNSSKKYFTRRIFSNFKINVFFKDNILFKQNQKMNYLIFIKDGILELALQNMSFYEFHKLIKDTKDIIIKKAKEVKFNIKEFFDFDTNVESKTNYNLNTLKGILHQKQNFLFHRNEKGIFGDYEFFFGLPALLTGTVVSDKCLLYYYEYDKYKAISDESYLFNESLKYNSFVKLKSLLKRMIMVYNSYWRLSMEQLAKNLQEKEKMLHIINDEEKEQTKKSVFNSMTLKNAPLINSLSSISSSKGIEKINTLNGLLSTGRYNSLYKNTGGSYCETNTNRQTFINTNSNNFTRFINNNMAMSNNITDMKKTSHFKNHITESNSQKKMINRTIKTQILISNDNPVKKGYSVQRNKNKEIGKEDNIDYKTLNDEKYQKNLIKDFKQAMNAQRVANKKEHKKIFLPPINYSSQKFYNPKIIENNFIKKNKKAKKINLEDSPFKLKKYNENIKTCLKKNSRNNLNESLNRNKSFSERNNNKSEYSENDKTQRSIKDSFYDIMQINTNNKTKPKSLIKKKNYFKMAQLYSIQLRKDKKHTSLDNSLE
jgi:CRP-like cAMP-binding protein